MNKNEFKKDSTYQGVKKNGKWEALGYMSGMFPSKARFDYGFGFKKFTFPKEESELQVFVKLADLINEIEFDLMSIKDKKNIEKIKEIFDGADIGGGWSTIVYIKRPDGSFAYKAYDYDDFINLKNNKDEMWGYDSKKGVYKR